MQFMCEEDGMERDAYIEISGDGQAEHFFEAFRAFLMANSFCDDELNDFLCRLDREIPREEVE